MSAIEKITIALPAEMVAEIRAAVEAGDSLARAKPFVMLCATGDAPAPSSPSMATNSATLWPMPARAGEPVDGEPALLRLRAKYAAMATEG